MKSNPSFSSDEVGFHHEVISSTKDGFIPSTRTDLTEKSTSFEVLFSGGDEGDRTLDLTNANRTLSQLSYAPEFEVIGNSEEVRSFDASSIKLLYHIAVFCQMFYRLFIFLLKLQMLYDIITDIIFGAYWK